MLTAAPTCRGCGCQLSITQSLRGLCDNPECRRKDVGYQEQIRCQSTLTLIRQRIPASWNSNISIAVLPHNTQHLIPLTSERVKIHRQYLERIVKEARKLAEETFETCNETSATTSGINPSEAELPVLDAACGLCGGHCCHTGGNTAWLEPATIQRLQWHRLPVLDQRIVEHYLSYLPEISFENSCIYHAENGCCLPRKIRSNVCNQYLCKGLSEIVNDLSGPDGTCVTATMNGNALDGIALADAMGILERLKQESE